MAARLRLNPCVRIVNKRAQLMAPRTCWNIQVQNPGSLFVGVVGPSDKSGDSRHDAVRQRRHDNRDVSDGCSRGGRDVLADTRGIPGPVVRDSNRGQELDALDAPDELDGRHDTMSHTKDSAYNRGSSNWPD